VDLLISLASSQIFPLAWPGSFLGPCRRFPCEERACVWLGPRASVTVLSGDLIRFLAILDSLRKDFLSLNFFVSSAGLCSLFGRGLHRLPLSFSVFSARSHLFRARDLLAALLYRLIFRRPSLLSVFRCLVLDFCFCGQLCSVSFRAPGVQTPAPPCFFGPHAVCARQLRFVS
jgi:hypothetical protein